MENEIVLLMPIKGKVVDLSEVNDSLFSKKVLGEGAAIIPEDDFVYSPVDGEITLVYESKHALTIKTEQGIEILIHVGIDSVKLEGRGFSSYVKIGEKVKRGDKILFFDREYVGKFSELVTPIVITNSEIVDKVSINFGGRETKDDFINLTLN